MKVLFNIGLLMLLFSTAVFAQSEADTSGHEHHHKNHKHQHSSSKLVIGLGVGSGTFDRFNKLFSNADVPAVIGNELGLDFTFGIVRRMRRLEVGLIGNTVYCKKQDNGIYGVSTTLVGLHLNVGYNVIPKDYRVGIVPFVGIGYLMANVNVTRNGGMDYSQIQSYGLQSASVTLRNYSAQAGIAVKFKVLGIKWRLQNGFQFGLPSNQLSTDGRRISGAPKIGFNSMYSSLCFDF